jgi:hypothetical protein
MWNRLARQLEPILVQITNNQLLILTNQVEPFTVQDISLTFMKNLKPAVHLNRF